MKPDKRTKYPALWQIESLLGESEYSFSWETELVNKQGGRFDALIFYRNGRKAKAAEAEEIEATIRAAFPKADVQSTERQHRYAPEIRDRLTLIRISKDKN